MSPGRPRRRPGGAAAAASRRLTSAGDVRTPRGRSGVRQRFSTGLAFLCALLATLLLAAAADAQVTVAPGLPGTSAEGQPPTQPSTAPSVATPPVYGSLYRDGVTDKWLLGGTWLYRPDPTEIGVAQQFFADTPSVAGWSPVTVPNSFNAGDLSDGSMAGAIGWYRRDFTLPAGAFSSYVPARFRSWLVRFESVNYTATVWLNGRPIGSHAGAYLPWELALKGVHAGVNELVVRVDSQRTPADLPQGPGGGWWNFGGINQEVYLRAVQRVDMTPVVVRPILPCPTCAATIQEQVSVVNPTGSPQTVALQGTYGAAKLDFGADTIAPHGTWIARTSVVIAHPQLWAPGSPYLYKASLTAMDADGRKLQQYVTYSGIRSIQVTSTGALLLNGRQLNLRGFSIHEQNLQTGAALTPAQLAALVNWDRELGGGIIRAHYPLDPQIEEDADRDGILLWSEVPVYQTTTPYLTQPAWLTAAHTFLATNILTNENHPSILLWSIGNELPQPANDAVKRYIAGAAQLAHQLDPTRPVAMATLAWPNLACQSAYAPLDVVGINTYFGWFDAGGGSNDDLDSLGPYLDSVHACYPNKALMVTEFGYEGNRDGPVEERGTFANQAASAQFNLDVFAAKPYLSGALWFAMQDFAARPGWTGGNPIGDPPFVQKGPIDIDGSPRQPLFDVMSAIYHATAQIAPTISPQARRIPAGGGF